MTTSAPKRVHPFVARLNSGEPLSDYQKGIIFGPSGAGKTTLIASAALDKRTSPIIVLDFDGGSRSLEGMDKKLLRYTRVESWEHYNEAYDYLSKYKHPFKTVSIDSLTETHLFSLLGIVDYELEHNARRKENPDPNAVEQSDYGHAMVQMRRFLREWRKLPMHCLYTALTKTETKKREGLVQLPAMFGQMAEEVVGLFDFCVYLTLKPEDLTKPGAKPSVTNRILTLQNTPGIRAKIRTPFYSTGPKLPDRLEIAKETGITTLFDALNIPQPDDEEDE